MTASRAHCWLIAAGVVCGAWGLASIAIYLTYLAKHPVQDWMVYYAAARAYLDGNLPLIFDGERFTAHLNQYFAHWLREPIGFRSWVYPPPFLLVLIPFGLLGFAAACALFESLTFAALVVAVSSVAGPGRRLLQVASLALAPATWFNIVVGQNGFLTGALLIGGFGAVPRRPVLAGVLLGLLSYKPQFWLLVPVALTAAGEWRALASAVVAAAAVAFGSVAVLGSAAWLAWIGWALHPPAADYQRFLACCRLHDESVYTNLALLGAPVPAADFGQLCAMLLAGGAVWWCFRRKLPRDLRLAVLLAAIFLAAPHVANYDAVLLVVAATLLFAHGLDRGLRPGGVVIPLAVWMIQLFNPPDAFPIGRLTPLLTVLLILYALAQAGLSASAGVSAAPGGTSNALRGP